MIRRFDEILADKTSNITMIKELEDQEKKFDSKLQKMNWFTEKMR